MSGRPDQDPLAPVGGSSKFPLRAEEMGQPYFVFTKTLSVKPEVAIARILKVILSYAKPSRVGAWVPRYRELSRTAKEIHYEVDIRQKPPGWLEQHFPRAGAPRVIAARGEATVKFSPFHWVEEWDASDLRGTFGEPSPVAYGRVRQVTTLVPWTTGTQLKKEYYQRFFTDAGRAMWDQNEKAFVALHRAGCNLLSRKLEES